jgi:hypothetical protein
MRNLKEGLLNVDSASVPLQLELSDSTDSESSTRVTKRSVTSRDVTLATLANFGLRRS